MAEIQIIEPQVFELSVNAAFAFLGIPELLVPISIPPAVGLSFSFDFSYTCPMAVYCSSSNPCNWQKTVTLPLAIPLPEWSLPAIPALPILNFRIQIPPPIFVTCPFFPESDWTKNKDQKDDPRGGRKEGGARRTSNTLSYNTGNMTTDDIANTT